MNTVLANIASLVIFSTTAQAGLEFPGQVDLERILHPSPNSYAKAEMIDCASAMFHGYLPEDSTKVLQRFKDYELRDGLRHGRVLDSFLRKGIKNADCISITVIGGTRDSIEDQVNKAMKVVDKVFDQQERIWKHANYSELKAQELGKINYVKIKNPKNPRLYCSGNQFIAFSKKAQLWSVNKTPERSNSRDLTYVFALEAKGKDMIRVSNGYGCPFRNETKSISDVKLWRDFKDVNPLDPKEDQITFERDYL